MPEPARHPQRPRLQRHAPLQLAAPVGDRVAEGEHAEAAVHGPRAYPSPPRAAYHRGMPEPTRTAVGTWSGGRFMRFGEPLDDERLAALLRPGRPHPDGPHRRRLRRGRGRRAARPGARGRRPRRLLHRRRRRARLLHGRARAGAKGFPRFTDPALRGPDGYADYLRMATERSLERIGDRRLRPAPPAQPGPHRLHERGGLERHGRAARRRARRAGSGVAPGPANGFTLDLLDCFERFGGLIDWAMIILNPLEPWPGELVLDAARHHDVRLITRVVDYGGLFHDDVLPGPPVPAAATTATFRPEGWVEARTRQARPRCGRSPSATASRCSSSPACGTSPTPPVALRRARR